MKFWLEMAKKNMIMFILSVHNKVENCPCHITNFPIVEAGVQLDTQFLVG